MSQHDRRIDEIATKATEVARIDADRHAAIAEERDTEALVLVEAIALAKPALGAVANVIGPEFPERGLRLVDLTDSFRGESGQVRSESLWLLNTGELVSVLRNCNVTGMTMMSPREAMDRFDLRPCLDAIVRALDGQLRGSATKAAEKARARTEKLRAMLALAGK